MKQFRTGVFAILLLASALSASLIVYAAQPWDGHDASRAGDGYFVLAVLLYTMTPNVGLALFSKLFHSGDKALAVFLIGALGISGAGASAYLDSMFFRVDAQGALVFLFVPAYQWLAIAVLTIACLAMRRLNEMRDEVAEQCGNVKIYAPDGKRRSAAR